MTAVGKKAFLTTLGCRLNQADTALMLGLLESAGVTPAETETEADVIIVNTCAVTAMAAQKSRQAVRKIRKTNPSAMLIVTGCGVNTDADSWRAEPAVDYVLSPAGRASLPEVLIRFFSDGTLMGLEKKRVLHTPENPGEHTVFQEGGVSRYPFKTRAFLKVQDGCNCFCSYCIVPFARGPRRSRDVAEVMRDFRALLAAGHREIIIAGVNTCTYQSADGGLTSLLHRLVQEPGDFRIRLSSAEPHPELLNFIRLAADYPEKICRFLHLPAQHLTDKILKLMNRHYTLETYLNYIAEVRRMIPDLHVGTDLIVGFPGETDHDFESAYAVAESIGFANMHIFPFSPREGTAAAAMKNELSGAIVKARCARLNALADRSAEVFAESQRGKSVTVLVETLYPDGMAEGWTDHYLRLRFPVDSSVKKGDLVTLVSR